MATWYVRPDISHNTVRDGTSYSTAWGGWSEIVWGSGGVFASDTLYICGTHLLSSVTNVGNHTGSVGTEAIFRGDYIQDVGTLSFIVGGTYLVPKSHSKWKNITIQGVSRCILSAALTNHVMENVTFIGGTNPIFSLPSTSVHNHSDISFLNCYFTGGGAASVSGSHAAFDWFCSTAGAQSTVTRLTFDGCTFKNVNLSGTARGVVGLRSQEITDSASIVKDFTFTNNIIEDCRGYAVELFDGHSIYATTPIYGAWKGIQIVNNSIKNIQTENTGILGGAFSLFGIDNSTTSSFGLNKISKNKIKNVAGQAGGINLGYGTALIEQNTIDTLTTTSIDACGILIDIGAKDCIVRKNTILNTLGKTGVFNSGCSIMVLDATNSFIYGNKTKTSKCGLFFGTMTVGNTAYVFNNTFLDNKEIGIYIASGSSRSTIFVNNNIFTCLENTNAVSIQDTVGSWGNENYNYFSNSFLPAINHTMGDNNVVIPIKLQNIFFPAFSSSSIASGTYLGNFQDNFSSTFQNPPSVGAFEYIRPRTFRV